MRNPAAIGRRQTPSSSAEAGNRIAARLMPADLPTGGTGPREQSGGLTERINASLRTRAVDDAYPGRPTGKNWFLNVGGVTR